MSEANTPYSLALLEAVDRAGRAPVTFDAIVLAASPHAREVVLGLTLVERGRRVAARSGARRVFVVEDAGAARELAAWHADGGAPALLVLRAGDQVVHPPLAQALLEASGDRRIAVTPEGAYAGALWVARADAVAAVAALARDLDDAALAASLDHPRTRVPHGRIARHPATTRDERRGATRMLMRILVKEDEDSPTSKYFYRPLSRPITRLLVSTPITPNQVTCVTLLLGILGAWVTAQAGQRNLILGAALIVAGCVIDGCDGELSRLRLTSSKFGAWFDTVVDEATTTMYFIALGLHTSAHHPDQTWIAPSIAIGLACYLTTVYGIYFFLIVVSKTGNSQHYIGDLEIVGTASDAVLRARPRSSRAPAWVKTLIRWFLLALRRDFINLFALAVTFFNGYFMLYVMMLGGGVLTAVGIVPEHIKLRRQLREVARRGATPRLVI